MNIPSARNETRLRSLIRSVLQEDGLIKRADSEQTDEKSLQPRILSPSEDPFTTDWYASLIPHKIRESFKAPDMLPSFFHVRDAQHAALFSPNTPSGGSQEADLLYQAIAFLHRALDDILLVVDRNEIVNVWKSVRGVSEMLHTRYDLLCALRRSRDDQHVRCLEMYMQPPSGDSSASVKVHREICRAVSAKRPREQADNNDGPPPIRVRTLPDETTDDDVVEIPIPAENMESQMVNALNKKKMKDGKTKAASVSAKLSMPHASQSKTVADASKPKRSTPAKTSSSPTVLRKRCSDVASRLRSSSTPANTESGEAWTKAGKFISTPGKQVATVKSKNPKKEVPLNKKATSAKKVESKTQLNLRKSGAADKNVMPKKQGTSTKSVHSTSGTSSKPASRRKKSSPNQRVTPTKRALAAKQSAQTKSQTTLEDTPSVKESDFQNKWKSTNQSNVPRADTKVDEETESGDKIAPDPGANGAKTPDVQVSDDVEIVHLRLNEKEGSVEEKNGDIQKEHSPRKKIRR